MNHRETREPVSRSVRLRESTWRTLAHLRIDRKHSSIDETVCELIRAAADTIHSESKESPDA